MNTKFRKTIDWYIYKPLDWQKSLGYGINRDGCRFTVPDRGRSVGFHQCTRAGKEEIEGVKFCRAHAKVVREALARMEE